MRKSTGKTHGIRLRMRPPRKARPMAPKTVTSAGVTCLAALAAGVRPEVTTPGVTGRGELVVFGAGELDEAVESFGERGGVVGALEGDANAVRKRLQLLVGGVLDDLLIEGVELGVLFVRAGLEGELDVLSRRRWQRLTSWTGSGFGDQVQGFAESADDGCGRDGAAHDVHVDSRGGPCRGGRPARRRARLRGRRGGLCRVWRSAGAVRVMGKATWSS